MTKDAELEEYFENLMMLETNLNNNIQSVYLFDVFITSLNDW